MSKLLAELGQSDGLLTSRKRNATLTPIMKMTAATTFGRANGNLVHSTLSPKRLGNFFAGVASEPPSTGPKTDPILHTRGMMLKARGCSDLWVTISATGKRQQVRAAYSR